MRLLPMCLVLFGLPVAPGVALAAEEVAAEAASGSASAEIRCRRFAEPGTLIKKRKICLTRDQWNQVAEEAQRKIEYLQFNNMGGADGCKPGSPGC